MQPIDRHAARVLLLTPEKMILLIETEVAPGRLVWLAPGGGVEAGESPRQAAERRHIKFLLYNIPEFINEVIRSK